MAILTDACIISKNIKVFATELVRWLSRKRHLYFCKGHESVLGSSKPTQTPGHLTPLQKENKLNGVRKKTILVVCKCMQI